MLRVTLMTFALVTCALVALPGSAAAKEPYGIGLEGFQDVKVDDADGVVVAELLDPTPRQRGRTCGHQE